MKITGHSNAWWLAGYVLAVMAALFILRLAWVWVSFRFTLLRQADGKTPHSPDWRIFVAMALAGVRGTITLAGVLTIPLALSDGSPFPARDLAIFLAAGVIIVSLIIASVALPLLLRDLTMPAEPSGQAEENTARIAAAEAAICEIERVQHELAEGRGDADIYAAAGARIMDLYRERIETRSHDDAGASMVRKLDRIDRDLRLAAVGAERREIFRLARERRIGSETAHKLVRELDLLEVRYKG